MLFEPALGDLFTVTGRMNCRILLVGRQS